MSGLDTTVDAEYEAGKSGVFVAHDSIAIYFSAFADEVEARMANLRAEFIAQEGDEADYYMARVELRELTNFELTLLTASSSELRGSEAFMKIYPVFG